MNWFILSILSAVSFASGSIIGKHVSASESEPVFVSLLANVYAAVASYVIVLFLKPVFPNAIPLNAIFGLIASVVLCAAGTLLYWQAMKMIDISEFVLFTRTQILFVFIGSIVLYNETFSPIQLAGIAAIISGSLLICYEKGKVRLTTGALIALSSALFFAAEVMIDKSIMSYFSPIWYTAFLYTGITAILFIPAYFVRKQRKSPFPGVRSNGIIAVSSFLFSVAAILFFSSYTHGGTVALTGMVTQLQVPIIVLYGIVFLKERIHIRQKVISMCLMMIGMYILRV